MKQKRKTGYSFTNVDISAIVCALPLVSNIEADTPAQTQLNRQCCAAAAEKLLSHSPRFLPNELRVMSAAVDVALDILSGMAPDLAKAAEVDAEWRSELSGYFFTYNRLRPVLDGLIQPYMK